MSVCRRFSGLTAEDFAPGQTVTLEEVQRKMLGLVGDDTILLGHGLESDLRSLKVLIILTVGPLKMTIWIMDSLPHAN